MKRAGNGDGDPARARESIARRGKFSDALVADAVQLFEERLGRPVSSGEARNMLGDLVDFFVIGARWSRSVIVRPEESPADCGGPGSDAPGTP
jgi:hypothetical protein